MLFQKPVVTPDTDFSDRKIEKLLGLFQNSLILI